MTTLMIEHRVADYATWREVYDAVEPVRASGGVRSHRVLQQAGDPNHVVVEHVFDDAASAGAFLENPDLRDVMARGGVIPDSVRPLLLENAR